LERLRARLSELEYSKSRLSKQMEDLQKERKEMAERDTEIQRLLTEAGANYEKLSLEAGLGENAQSLGESHVQPDRGLENLGAANGDNLNVKSMI